LHLHRSHGPAARRHLDLGELVTSGYASVAAA